MTIARPLAHRVAAGSLGAETMIVAARLPGTAAEPHTPRKERMMQKIKLELDELEITSFDMRRADDEKGGTVIANSTIYGCTRTYTYETCLCNTDPDFCA
jgi:hypothetical protein